LRQPPSHSEWRQLGSIAPTARALFPTKQVARHVDCLRILPLLYACRLPFAFSLDCKGKKDAKFFAEQQRADWKKQRNTLLDQINKAYLKLKEAEARDAQE
jgi:hypothetical protein